MDGGNTAKNISSHGSPGFMRGTGCLLNLAMTQEGFQFSSLILTGQMTRGEALEKLKGPAYDPETIEDDFRYIAAKLDITEDELRSYLHDSNKSYKDYKNREWMFVLGARILKSLGIERAIKR